MCDVGNVIFVMKINGNLISTISLMADWSPPTTDNIAPPTLQPVGFISNHENH